MQQRARTKLRGLFDHLVGAADQRQRNGEAEGLGSLRAGQRSITSKSTEVVR